MRVMKVYQARMLNLVQKISFALFPNSRFCLQGRACGKKNESTETHSP